MFVKNRMTANPYTVSYNSPITDLMELMHDKNLKRVPVVDGDKVVGIVTNSDLAKVTPNQATTLSVWEINYLLAKMPVSKAMNKNVVTVSPDDFVEQAAVLMRKHRISALAVVEEDNKLVGIVTESDIFDAFIDLLGVRNKGSRVTITVVDKPGVLAQAAQIISDQGANIARMVAYERGDGITDLVFKIDLLETDSIVKALDEAGLKVTNITKRLDPSSEKLVKEL